MVLTSKLSPPKWQPQVGRTPSPHPISQTTATGQRHRKPRRGGLATPFPSSHLCPLATQSALGRSLRQPQVHSKLRRLLLRARGGRRRSRQGREEATSRPHPAPLPDGHLRGSGTRAPTRRREPRSVPPRTPRGYLPSPGGVWDRGVGGAGGSASPCPERSGGGWWSAGASRQLPGA